MKLRFPLYQQIIASVIGSILFAYFYLMMGWEAAFVAQYVKPLGQLFMKSLKLLLVPLVISTLMLSVGSADNVVQFSWIGIKTVSLYILTTILSVTLGLTLGFLVNPGRLFPKAMRDALGNQYVGGHANGSVGHRGMPDNLVAMLMENQNLLYIVVFALICGVLLYRLDNKRRSHLLDLCESLRALFMEFMQVIMRLAPIGVFSMVASELIITGEKNPGKIGEYLFSLLPYMGSVIGGLCFMTFFFYPLLVKIFTRVGFFEFIKRMYPAQLFAFSTSSSTAALPVTTDQVTGLGVDRKISEALLSLGAVININGTALYQGIAAMFITQAFGVELSLQQHIGIVVYVTITTIGEGGMPGGSLTSTAILLGMLGIPEERGLALIFLPDRLLDMCRSATNITGDGAVTLMVAASEKKIDYKVYRGNMQKK